MEVGTRAWGTAVIGWTMVLFGGIQNTLGFCNRKAIEHFNWALMGHTSRIKKNSRGEGYLSYYISCPAYQLIDAPVVFLLAPSARGFSPCGKN